MLLSVTVPLMLLSVPTMAGESTSASRSSCHAVRSRPGTPPKKIPEKSTLVSRMTRSGVERRTGAIARADGE
jgi:hypothetical protein